HDVADFFEAKKKYYAAIDTRPTGIEQISIHQAHGRVLAEKIIAKIDVPPFARSTKDGFAVVASDTFFADEENPKNILFSGEKSLRAICLKRKYREEYVQRLRQGQ